MQITAISDTHGKHYDKLFNQWLDEIENKETSMIVHTGDVSMSGTKEQVLSFFEWYESLTFKYKILIAGNHDWIFERDPKWVRKTLKKYPSIIYLENEEVIIEGVKFYGSPTQPWFHDWAFNRYRGDDIQKVWDQIPKDTRILLTHGPPYLKGDLVPWGNEHVGCVNLLAMIELIKPEYNIFGHIHEGAGISYNEYTIFINASSLDGYYELVNKPITFNIETNGN